MKQPLIEINDFKGGMTLNEKLGREDQFHIGYNLDFSSKPGKITNGRGTVRMRIGGSVDMPTQFPWIVQTSDHNLYFGGEDTKIYKQSAMGTIIEAHDDANTGGIKGMIEYGGYLIWAGDTTLGRFDLSSTWTDSWQTGLTNARQHPMIVSGDNVLYIAHGHYIASWDGTTFTPQALDLAEKWEIKALANFGYRYLAIGAEYVDSSNQPTKYSKVFLWNRTSGSWNDEIIVPENSIQAMIFSAGYLWVWAGESSNIYVIPENSRIATKMWTFTKETEQNLVVYPGAVTQRRGTIYFGLSDAAGATADQYIHPKNPTGIYSFPADPTKFSLNIPYKNRGYREKFKGLQQVYWGSTTNCLYFSEYSYTGVSWETRLRRELTSGNNEALYQSAGVYESFRFEAPVNKKMVTEVFGIECEPLPSGTSVELAYKKDNDTSWTDVWIGSDFQTANATEKLVKKKVVANSLKLKLTLNGSVSADYRPFVKRIFVTGHLINKNA